ncbi:unnamed protein product [marine sediment metagenome]|uniref:Uncharacterized protein n=1 Tax=marine sediment metagenome TaxID=412755 RepID=X0VLH1_9ZZZZ
MGVLENLPEGVKTPPPCPSEAYEAWKPYHEHPRTRPGSGNWRGVLWYLNGETLTESARLAGCKDHQNIRRVIRAYGLAKFVGRTDTLVNISRQVARASGLELLQRVEDEPEKFSNKDLYVTNGINITNITNHEKNVRGGNTTFLDSVSKLAADVVASGATLTMTIGPGHPDAIEEKEVDEITIESTG